MPWSWTLRAAGLHGHKHAIDAMLCATALQYPGRVTILTSDVEDIGLLTARQPRRPRPPRR
ncbi:hypothetical protein ACFC8N_11570 [Streptomyces sp. NPDC055966]|uniref:hypothetical protein n=1 Tax=Streptomyces sp. NPDC055966 TaxID=3345669 RepID=UPI0035DD7171